MTYNVSSGTLSLYTTTTTWNKTCLGDMSLLLLVSNVEHEAEVYGDFFAFRCCI